MYLTNFFYKLTSHGVTRPFKSHVRQEVLGDSKEDGTGGRGQGAIVCELSHFELFCPILLLFGHLSMKVLLSFPIEALCLSISLGVISGRQFLFDAQKFISKCYACGISPSFKVYTLK